MIDHGMAFSQLPVILYYARQILWLDLWPVGVGFVTMFCYQLYMRIGLSGVRNKLVVFTVSAAASMLALFGWMTMLRTARIIPLYSCGVGLATVLSSQIYLIKLSRRTRFQLLLPRVIWRSDETSIRALMELRGGEFHRPLERAPNRNVENHRV